MLVSNNVNLGFWPSFIFYWVMFMICIELCKYAEASVSECSSTMFLSSLQLEIHLLLVFFGGGFRWGIL